MLQSQNILHIDSLVPTTDMVLVALLQKGNVEPGVFSAAIKQMEKKNVSMETRANQRVLELYQIVQAELGRKVGTYRTLEEWNYLRKIARNSVRFCRCFSKIGVDYADYFKNVYETAANMVACETREVV